MLHKTQYPDHDALAAAIDQARGLVPADLVIRNVQLLDVFSGQFMKTDLAIGNGRIVGIGEGYQGKREVDGDGQYAVPGFIDAHVHIESSLMTPARFQEAVLPCGTTTVLWDPHEIANVKGLAGIEWALKSSEDLLLDIFVMVPSCVPSTNPGMNLESSGATLYAADIQRFREHPRVLGLAEMMNFPGLLNKDPDVLQKLLDFQALRRDGHCPGLSGKDLNAYAIAGICSCHESTTAAEAREKMSKGIHVLVREGSCAKDAETLLPLLTPFSSATMAFCSDDRNPLDIQEEGHISAIAQIALKHGKTPEEVFRAASFSAARIYGMDDRGALAPGYLADFNLIKPRNGRWHNGFDLLTTYKKGVDVKAAPLKSVKALSLSGHAKNLNMELPTESDLCIPTHETQSKVRVIGVIPHQILTHHEVYEMTAEHGELRADLARDILKISVWERHHGSGNRSIAFVRGFGLTQGAIATSINHDSHNVIAVGSSDAVIIQAIEELKRIDGGIVVATEDGRLTSLPLPIGGLMTDADPDTVARKLRELKALARAAGCVLEEPFLQLSFLALPVIPSLKITDRGLVDVNAFQKVPVFCEILPT